MARSTTNGHGTDDSEQELLRKAVRLEWLSIVVLAATFAVVGLVAGQSQAMKAAWIEDGLSLLPPIAFLVASRMIRKPANRRHPYGHHRAIATGHMVAATALLAMGSFLVYGAVSSLVGGEKPPIGLIVLFGQDMWLGWLMVGVIALSGIPPVLLGRAKMKLAEPLHDKVLYADADMNKADWMTALSTVIGVLGIGVGLWWMDSVAALVVSASIIYDGVVNLRAAVRDLSDTRAVTLEGGPHPLIEEAESISLSAGWVADAAARVRDQGHVFHAEIFVRPHPGHQPTVTELEALGTAVRRHDWKLNDVVVVPVSRIPEQLRQAEE
ncbi:cation diffusion facilitator family transporter [Corynebacterium guangdongense]|uniref:Divalent metal cation (Fe/Co/Zn/Cd) transporter n=1 Tax=Corynebacterium guangdongense TaxID=1783348 RepID=A0ABU1ZVP6_9CORY|nr:cation diffusion facilitator family transporter [Corynebacterium guangdongense]MDR7328980.1 divalent metal cation (Fe/Co/Zn/Cd) transporter [Corynebacterium guangdongense]WJZ17553.1 Cation efflux family protein [Corynebacterium guangdongense]